MPKVLSSDSNEHSTPLSNNKGRRGTNVPLLSSVSLLDNADNNAELSAPRQPSPISPSGQSASSSTTLSNYTRRPSLAFQQQQQQQDQEQEQHQQGSQRPPSPDTLTRHGIKVRDFAYESNLPLIPSIPRARKVRGARPLKRTKRYFEQADDVFTLDSHSQSQSAPTGLSQAFSLQHESINRSSTPRPLERKSTEPAIIPERERQRPFRDVGYADLSQHPSGSQAAQRSLRHTLTPITPIALARATTTFSPVSLPFPFPATKKYPAGGSQESDLSTDTPLITPRGSLTWPTITSDVPASQLDNNSSQAPALVQDDTTATYSQLGFSPPSSQAPDYHPDAITTTVDDATLGSSPPPTEVGTDLPPDHLVHLGDNARASSPPSPSPARRTRTTTRSSTDRTAPLTPNAGGPRYFLRKHGSPGQERESSPSSLHRRRKSPTKAAPAPYPRRVRPVTRQSAHAVASDSPGRSARARPLRKTTM